MEKNEEKELTGRNFPITCFFASLVTLILFIYFGNYFGNWFGAHRECVTHILNISFMTCLGYIFWLKILSILPKTLRSYEKDRNIDLFLGYIMKNNIPVEKENDNFLRVEINHKKYFLWNSNYPYAWLSECVMDTPTLSDENIIWSKLMPSRRVMEKFARYVNSQYVDSNNKIVIYIERSKIINNEKIADFLKH
ncbi:MAG: hypothetical protein IKO41_06325 [Lachnospiraceae bacterium]|nr:hypothetical protein [Treponema sp.]MBR4605827.1 hypothetical protein [Lachnospiraceae bacterium]